MSWEWEEFKKDSEALDHKPAKGLGLCEISFGCIKGKPYIEVMPIVSRIKSEEGLQGFLVEILEEDLKETYQTGDAIMELAKNNEEINNSEKAKATKDKFEKEMRELYERYQAEVDAINSLEI